MRVIQAFEGTALPEAHRGWVGHRRSRRCASPSRSGPRVSGGEGGGEGRREGWKGREGREGWWEGRRHARTVLIAIVSNLSL